jgi:hypothetical protein
MSSTKSSALFEPRAQITNSLKKSTLHVRNSVKGALPRILWHDTLPCLAALSGQPTKPEGRAFASCLSLPD